MEMDANDPRIVTEHLGACCGSVVMFLLLIPGGTLSPDHSTRSRVIYMLGLILAGEAVFALPFHVTRFFRASVLETFGLTNTELGAAQAIYGIVAMLAYFPGGPLADRFSARTLLVLSLFSTAVGGLYMSTLPGPGGAMLVWGFFGLTTIFLFWAALIKATRQWGGRDEQGRAYGLLEGGRGLLAAGLASLGAMAFGFLFPEGFAVASLEDKKEAVRMVILGYSLVTLFAGIFVWFALADDRATQTHQNSRRQTLETTWTRIAAVLKIPTVWLIAMVVICAYVAYKGFENYSLYAVQGFGMDEVEAAQLVALGAWMRPVAALAAGLLGDRYLVSRMTVICFALLLGSQLFFAVYTPQPAASWVLLMNVLIGSSAAFGLRALYFALFEESKIPLAVTGTAVGLVSVLGYTPDIFVSYIGGMLLDASPGLEGHQDYFCFLAAFAALGLVVSLTLMLMLRRRQINVQADL